MKQEVSINDIIPIRALKDNYIWTLLDRTSKKAYVIDPGVATPVIKTLNELQFTLAGILITHHHWDHSAGVSELLHYAGNIPVIASHRSSLPEINKKVKEDDVIDLSFLQLKAMEIPGHTLDHIAYYVDSFALFSGDTLFSAGCGRIFEGDPRMMYDSLQKLLTLDDKTYLYCGHEYTLANLNFAKEVEPKNKDILDKINSIKQLSGTQFCTLPSTLGAEKKYNPFLRCGIPDVQLMVEKYAEKKLATPLEVFTSLRQWKNDWR